MIFRIVFLFLILFIVEVYFFQILKTLIKSRPMLLAIEGLSMFFLLYIIYSLMQFDRSVGQTHHTMIVMAMLLIVYVPKLILTFILIGEDIFRLGVGTVNYFVNYDKDADFFNSRRKFISQVGIGLAAIPFLSLNPVNCLT